MSSFCGFGRKKIDVVFLKDISLPKIHKKTLDNVSANPIFETYILTKRGVLADLPLKINDSFAFEKMYHSFEEGSL